MLMFCPFCNKEAFLSSQTTDYPLVLIMIKQKKQYISSVQFCILWKKWKKSPISVMEAELGP